MNTLEDVVVCKKCKKVSDRQGYYCSECLEKHNKYQRETGKFMRLIGICPHCRKNEIVGDEKLCVSCSAYYYARNRKILKEETAEHRLVRLERMRKSKKRLYAQHSADGICTRCGKRKAEPLKKKCRICLDKDAISARLYRDRKMKECKQE